MLGYIHRGLLLLVGLPDQTTIILFVYQSASFWCGLYFCTWSNYYLHLSLCFGAYACMPPSILCYVRTHIHRNEGLISLFIYSVFHIKFIRMNCRERESTTQQPLNSLTEWRWIQIHSLLNSINTGWHRLYLNLRHIFSHSNKIAAFNCKKYVQW